MVQQLPLRFPQPLPGFEDMTISASNRGPIAAARRIEHWPYHVFCLIGAPRSGLTSIAKAWANQVGAMYVDAENDPDALKDGSRFEDSQYIAIDRADLLVDDAELLTLISATRRLGGRLLLTARQAPTNWNNSSADLASRLKSAPLAELDAPDEEMMRARIAIAAKSAFIKIPPAVEEYLVTRLGLSYAAIEDMVERISGEMGGRELTVHLVREILEIDTGQGDLREGEAGT